MLLPSQQGLLPYKPGHWDRARQDEKDFDAAWDAAGKGARAGDLRRDPPNAKRFFAGMFKNMEAAVERITERENFDWAAHRERQVVEREDRIREYRLSNDPKAQEGEFARELDAEYWKERALRAERRNA